MPQSIQYLDRNYRSFLIKTITGVAVDEENGNCHLYIENLHETDGQTFSLQDSVAFCKI